MHVTCSKRVKRHPSHNLGPLHVASALENVPSLPRFTPLSRLISDGYLCVSIKAGADSVVLTPTTY